VSGHAGEEQVAAVDALGQLMTGSASRDQTGAKGGVEQGREGRV
jgi:hypothetical protein